MYLSKVNLILLGLFSEIIAHNMYPKIRQLYNNIMICELHLALPDFLEDICLADVNVYTRSYGI
jgi:hypothetical protein